MPSFIIALVCWDTSATANCLANYNYDVLRVGIPLYISNCQAYLKVRVINLLFNETSGCVSESNDRVLYYRWIQLKRELIRKILEQEQNQLSVNF